MYFGIGLLGWFKYAGFFAANLNALGVELDIPKIVLPVGISFFTFQGLSYVIDVYRGAAACQRSPFYVALYVTLFSQLVAGPIMRYSTVENEITRRGETLPGFSQGVARCIQELCLEHNLAVNALANLCGLAPSTIYSMLNKKSKNPGVVSIQKVCDGLEVSVREFFGDPLFENLEPIIK